MVPSDLGLPTAPADQDKYLALMKIISDFKKHKNTINNPITFTTAELLTLLGTHRNSGKNYQDVKEWLDRMTLTGIISERAVYLSGKDGRKDYRTATFHVFEAVVTKGHQLNDGTVAEKHHIFLSDWQLNNLRQNHTLPLDWDTYRQLTHHIAKALVFPLELMLYATRQQGKIEKRYDELCRFLGIREYKYLSDIKRKLGASLDELQHHGYLKRWEIQKTADKTAYKLVFWHGEKFHSDQRSLLSAETEPLPNSIEFQQEAPVEQGSTPDPLIARLEKWGFAAQDAASLLAELPEDQPIADQLEYFESEITSQGTGESGIRNPAGFIRARLEQNAPVPKHFQSSEQRQAQQEDTEARQAAQAQLQQDYEKYRRALALQHIEQNNLQDEYEAQELAKIDNLRHYLGERRPEAEIRKIAHETVLDQFASTLTRLKTFDAWQADQQQPPQRLVELSP